MRGAGTSSRALLGALRRRPLGGAHGARARPLLKLFGALHLPWRRGASGLEDDAPHLPRQAMNGVDGVTISSAGATW